MTLTFLDMEDGSNPRNGTRIKNHTELLQVLESLRGRTPFFCQLAAENGGRLDIGIGEPGCVQLSPNGLDPPYLMAVSPKVERHDDFEFLAGGTATPVSSQYCLSFELVRQIAVEYQQTGIASSLVSWEEI